MSSKAKLNEWCLVRKAKANYSVGQLPNTQLFLCVLDVLTTDGNMHTFTPSKGNTKKKLAENDAAQLALDALLQTKNEREEYAMILQAISDAIKNPCRNVNTAVIELLLEAFELSDGWINAVNNNTTIIILIITYNYSTGIFPYISRGQGSHYKSRPSS